MIINENLKVFALGGLDEKGKNLYVIEYKDEIIVFDAGLKVPEREILGVEGAIANYKYLLKNIDKIVGIFISKPTINYMGALPYILQEAKINVYGSYLTKILLNKKLKNLQFRLSNLKFNLIKTKDVINFKNIKVEVFKTSSSFPDSFGFLLSTPLGKIVYTGEYIFANNNNKNFAFDIKHLFKISEKKIFLLMTESVANNKHGYTSPYHEIKNHIEFLFKERQNRIIFIGYEDNLYHIQEIINLSIINEKKLIFYDDHFQDLVVNYLQSNPEKEWEKIISKKEEINQEKTVVIITGSGNNLFIKLNKIFKTNDQHLKFNQNDTIILFAPPVPGNELNYSSMLDGLVRTDAEVISLNEKFLLNANASKEDLKSIINILSPEYLMPVSSLYKDLISTKEIASNAGFDPKKILICDNGDIINFKKLNDQIEMKIEYYYQKNKDFQIHDIYIDGRGIGDISPLVISERKLLISNGVLIIALSLNKKTKEITSFVDVQMRGVINLDQNDDFLRKIKDLTIETINQFLKEKKQAKDKNFQFDIKEIKKRIKEEVNYFVKNTIEKYPMILPIINEI
jgi:ribonuclease J